MAKLWQKSLKTRKKAQLGEAEPFSNLLLSYLFFMVRQAGFEPAAYGFVVRRSIRAELLAHDHGSSF